MTAAYGKKDLGCGGWHAGAERRPTGLLGCLKTHSQNILGTVVH